MESPYPVMQFIPKRRPFPGSSEVQESASALEDHRPKQANFAVIYDSPSIGTGSDIALF